MNQKITAGMERSVKKRRKERERKRKKAGPAASARCFSTVKRYKKVKKFLLLLAAIS